MKIEKIRHNKLKVTVSAEDMIQWGINADAVAKNSPAAQDMFWDMLRRAENETGFEFDNSRLMVEAMPGEDEGVVLFVTRVENIPESARGRGRRLRVKNTDAAVVHTVCLRFDDFENLIRLAHENREFDEGTLYALEGVYYLVLSDKASARHSEYASAIENAFSQLLVEEHGTVVFVENAVAQIRERFKKIQ